jgi:hypothetical protein
MLNIDTQMISKEDNIDPNIRLVYRWMHGIDIQQQ